MERAHVGVGGPATRTRRCQHRQTQGHDWRQHLVQSALFLAGHKAKLMLSQPGAASMEISRQLSPHAPATAAAKTLKHDNGPARRPKSSHYLRQRQAMRAPLLPVRGMSMARGSETTYAMLQNATSTSKPRRKQTRKLPSDDLPPEAAALKRHIWDSHPGSLYKFRLDKMKRVVTPPVEIPLPLSDPTVLIHMVSGKTIPVTRLMWQQQRDLFKIKRLPSRIREGIAY